MAFLFGKKKSPGDLVKSTTKYIAEYFENESDERNTKKYQAKLTDTFCQMRVMLLGDSETEPKRENVDRLCDALLETELFCQLLDNFGIFEFESRKDVTQVLSYLIRHRREEIIPMVTRNPGLIYDLLGYYNHTELALSAGLILRELTRHVEICTLMLTMPVIEKLFGFVQVPIFDVASDAFNTLKTLLSRQKKIVATFLETHFDSFFAMYSKLLVSEYYVTKRFALKLLADLLLTRENFNVMMQYINVSDNLKTVMTLLKGNTKTIQIEAFHVFKVFVANPRKTDSIKTLLYRNKTKLIDFLTKFQKDLADEQFQDEKNILLNTLSALEPPDSA